MKKTTYWFLDCKTPHCKHVFGMEFDPPLDITAFMEPETRIPDIQHRCPKCSQIHTYSKSDYRGFSVELKASWTKS